MLGLVLVYLLGCFPSGLLISHIVGDDVTKKGSGNVGATNVARSLGLKYGLIVLILDALKGLLGVMVGVRFGIDPRISALVAVLGHVISIPYVLKGGKGVATFLGSLLGLSIFGFFMFLVSFIASFFLTKIVSISSLIAVWLVCALLLSETEPFTQSFFAPLVICAIVTVAHTKNLVRLFNGTEPKFNIPSKLSKG
ncbi:MAG: glycerol-3-phosphate 1-O-acyltransferase PlsY [Thermoplasmatales archaeon]